MKNIRTASFLSIAKLRERLPWQPFSFTLMKRFLILFVFILLLIISEYFLLSEFLSQQRLAIIISCLGAFVFSAYILIKVFRQTQEGSKG